MKIIIGGALGRMGRELALAAEGAGAEVACGVDVAYAGQAAAFPIVTGFERIREDADVLIDFSRPDALPELLQAALTRRMPVVLCATGYTDVELSSICLLYTSSGQHGGRGHRRGHHVLHQPPAGLYRPAVHL